MKPCGPKTLANHLTGIRVFFDWAVQSGIVSQNPCDGIRKPKQVEAQQRALTADEIAALILAAEADERSERPRCRFADGETVPRSLLYRLLALTALRVGSANKLRWRHVTLTGEQPRIQLPGSDMKSRRAHSVRIPYELATLLEAERDRRQPASGDLVFRPVRIEVFQSDAESAGIAIEDANGRRVGFHAIRRFFATDAAREGVSPKITQAILGHRHVETTLSYYTDAMRADMQDQAAAVTTEIGSRIAKAIERKGQHGVRDQEAPDHTEVDGEVPVSGLQDRSSGAA